MNLKKSVAKAGKTAVTAVRNFRPGSSKGYYKTNTLGEGFDEAKKVINSLTKPKKR